MQDEKIINKIQALIDKAQSTDSIEESNTFMAKAMELLSKHNIESFRLKRGEAKANIVQEKIALEEYYEKNLLRTLCENNLCEYVRLSWEDCIVVGKESNVNAVMYLFSWYRNQVIVLSIKSFNTAIRKEIEKAVSDLMAAGGDDFEGAISTAEKMSTINKSRYIDDYRSGCVYGVGCALREMGTEMGKVEDYGLMLVNNGDEVDAYIRAYIDSSWKIPVEYIPVPDPQPIIKEKKQPKYKPMGKRELKKIQAENAIYNQAFETGMKDGKGLRQNANQVKQGKNALLS